MPSTDGWLLLLQNILSFSDEQTKTLTVEETQQTVILTTTDQKIADSLNQALQSPDTIYRRLRYQIKKTHLESIPQTDAKEDYPAVPPLEQLLDQNIIQHIFHPEFLRSVGVQWRAQMLTEHGYVISFPIQSILESVTQAQIELYRKSLAVASLSDLRKAIAVGEKHVPLSIPKTNAAPGILADLVDKIFYMAKNKQGESIACFDVNLLCCCLTPPVLQAQQLPRTEAQDEENFKIEIDKTHFISYLSTALQESFILHIKNDDSDSQTKLAVPICFNLARTVPLENILSFVLDVSSSMQEVFAEYIAEIKKFLEEIEKQSQSGTDFQNTTIRIRPFSDESEIKSFSLQQGVAPINDYLNTLTASGKTYLSGTVADELSELQSECYDKNITLVVFTDGADNVAVESSLKRVEGLKNSIDKLTQPPKIFTYGLGKDYNEKYLTELSAMSGSEHRHLNVISEFKAGLTTHLNVYCKAIKLVRFVQNEVDHNGEELKGRQVAFNLKIQEGKVIAGTDDALVIPGTFTANGQTYTITHQVPVSQASDDITVVASTAVLQQLPFVQREFNRLPLDQYQRIINRGLASILYDQDGKIDQKLISKLK